MAAFPWSFRDHKWIFVRSSMWSGNIVAFLEVKEGRMGSPSVSWPTPSFQSCSSSVLCTGGIQQFVTYCFGWFILSWLLADPMILSVSSVKLRFHFCSCLLSNAQSSLFLWPQFPGRSKEKLEFSLYSTYFLLLWIKMVSMVTAWQAGN